MKQKTTKPKPSTIDNFTKHSRAELEPKRHEIEAQKKDAEQKLRELPDAVDQDTIMWAKAAGLTSLDDVIWRLKSGLTPKHAVEIAALQIFEDDLEAFRESHKGKSDAEILEMAAKAGVEHFPRRDMSRNQALIAILRKRQ